MFKCFAAALQHFKIYPLLDVDDLVADPPRCDDLSVITYVSEFLKYYKSEECITKDLDNEFAKYASLCIIWYLHFIKG
jgi:hypothetical protein